VARRPIRTDIETFRRVIDEAIQRLPAPTSDGAPNTAPSEQGSGAEGCGAEGCGAGGSAATSCQDLVIDDKPTRSPHIARSWPPKASAHKLIGEILRAGARLTAHRNALLAGFGMNSARLRLLKTIRRLPHPLPVTALARVMGVSRQTAQQTARDLEGAGFIMLTGNPRNGRAPLVKLSPSD
jgi:MarR family